MTDDPDYPAISTNCILTDCLHTAIASIFGILQLISQKPHHAGGIWVRSVDIIEVI